jgi:membrane associated rhomboid family serine protease
MSEPLRDDPREQQAEPIRREPVFNLPRIVIVFVALCVIVHAWRVYVLDIEQDLDLLISGAFIPIRYSGQFTLDVYAFTSPVTYSLLHGNLPHLAINMIWLAAFGSPLANRIGVLRFIAFWIATSLGAAGLHYVLHMTDQSPLVGASGAISGMMGAAARFAFRIDRSSGKPASGGPILPVAAVFRSRGVVTFFAIWMVVNLVTGLIGLGSGSEGQIAWEAHIGGFLVGFLAIGLFDRPGLMREAAPEPDQDSLV